MAKIDDLYNNLLKEILNNGYTYNDPNRKGVKRKEIKRYIFSYNMSNGFPALTTKKIYFKAVVGELLWILRGDTNIKYLNDNGINIWNKDAQNYNKGGDLGNVYGYQLRNFGGKFDQLKWIVDEMINNPLSTKKSVSFINPNDRKFQALTPCHVGFKIFVDKKDCKSFDLEFLMDSVDTFLGLPFNIASYAILGHILESLTGLMFKTLHANLNNVHIYENHLEQVKIQLKRNGFNAPDLEVPNIEFDKFGNIEDYKLINYKSNDYIKAEMLAYDK